jgi:putative endonuclease
MIWRSTRAIVRTLDWLAERILPPNESPTHLQTGRRGEEDAGFYLQSLGYKVVARNFRSPRRKGEIDLIAWDGDTLCFIEVKTRTTRDIKPAEAAVDRHKRGEMQAVAREYLRWAPPQCRWRVDIVSVYYEQSSDRMSHNKESRKRRSRISPPEFEVFRNASLAA